MLRSFVDDLSSIAHDLGIVPDSNLRDIERRLMILEEENKQLRDLGFYKSEVERLKLELNYASSLKHKYRNMYNEVAVKLMYLQNSDSLIFEENDQIVNLNQKIQMLVSANEDLKKTTDAAHTALVEEQEESRKLTEQLIPDLQREVEELQAELSELTQDTSTKPALSLVHIPTLTVEPCRKVTVTRSSPSKAKTKQSRDFPTEDGRKHASVGKATFKGYYLPSFMRNKRVVRKDSKTTKDEL